MDDSDDEAEEADISEPEDVEMRDETKEKSENLARLQAEKAALDLPARAAFKRASPVWKGLLRSKGIVPAPTSSLSQHSDILTENFASRLHLASFSS